MVIHVVRHRQGLRTSVCLGGRQGRLPTCRYEWADYGTQGNASSSRRLEFAQCLLLSPAAYAATMVHPVRLHGGAYSARALALGPQRIAVLAPQAQERQAWRLLKRRDTARLLQLAQQAAARGGAQPDGSALAPAWLQLVLAAGIVECMQQVWPRSVLALSTLPLQRRCRSAPARHLPRTKAQAPMPLHTIHSAVLC